jgi:hypothetical protein
MLLSVETVLPANILINKPAIMNGTDASTELLILLIMTERSILIPVLLQAILIPNLNLLIMPQLGTPLLLLTLLSIQRIATGIINRVRLTQRLDLLNFGVGGCNLFGTEGYSLLFLQGGRGLAGDSFFGGY